MIDTLLAEALRQRFQTDGYVCIEGWLDSGELDALRAEADALLAEHTTEETLRLGCVHETVPLHICCSSVAQFTRATRSPGSCGLLFTSEKVSRTAALLLSPYPHTAKVDGLRLFNEQFILKPAHSGNSAVFGWHRDSDWLDGQPPRYLSLWCALDDVSEENGTLYVLPGSHVAVDGELPPPPRTDAQASSCIMTVPAGTLVALSSTVLHCSGRNLSDAPRRAWMPQVSVGALVDPAGRLARHAVPLPSQ